MQTISDKYPAATPYKETRRLNLESEKSLGWARFRLRMAFLQFQSDRDPRELQIPAKRLAKIMELILPFYPGRKGTVYLLVNESFKGLMKVGITRRPVRQRLKELGTTGVPTPFVCIYAATVENPEELENRLLSIFERPSNKREFIKTGATLSWLLQFHQIEQVTPQEIHVVSGRKSHFETPYQGKFLIDYRAVNTRYYFHNEHQTEANLKKLGLTGHEKFEISNSIPLGGLSKLGYSYFVSELRKRLDEHLDSIHPKRNVTPVYDEKDSNILALKNHSIPRIMGEHYSFSDFDLENNFISYQPLKEPSFPLIMKVYGFGDIPFHALNLCQHLFSNLDEAVFVDGKTLMAIKVMNEGGYHDNIEHEKVLSRLIETRYAN